MLAALTIIWALLAMLVVVVTLLSLIPGRGWVMRVCDFPRAQMFILGLVLMVIAIVAFITRTLPSDPWSTTALVIGMLLLVSAVIQAVWAARLTRLCKPEVPSSGIKTSRFHKRHPELPDEHSIRLITANVDYTNSNPAQALEQLIHWRPHVLTLVETDEHWDEHIERFRESHPYVIKELRGLGRGLAVLSRLPIKNAEVRCLVDDDRPSIWTQLQLPTGQHIRLVVTHPPPPGLPKRRGQGRHSSKKRDIELDIIASRIRSHPDHHWVLCGDFNDVGWSSTTMRAKRVSGLRDPRVGRGMYSTFPASLPLLRYPIDHVLVSASFQLLHLMRLGSIGSDHLPLLTDLEIPGMSKRQTPNEPDALIYSPCANETREVELHRRERSEKAGESPAHD